MLGARGPTRCQGLTRWPALCAGGILRSLDYAGSVVFSVTGMPPAPHIIASQAVPGLGRE